MKTLSRGLLRLAPVVVAASGAGMYTDPESPAVQTARSELLERLHAAAPGSVVPLALGDVELSASCFAAVLGPILNAIVEKHLEGKFVLAQDPSGRNAWDADAGLKKESERIGRKLICVWAGKHAEPELVGPVDEQVKATYLFVLRAWRQHGEGATARELAEHFKVSIQAASNRLAKTGSLGLSYAADREAVVGGGAQYVFVPVV